MSWKKPDLVKSLTADALPGLGRDPAAEGWVFTGVGPPARTGAASAGGASGEVAAKEHTCPLRGWPHFEQHGVLRTLAPGAAAAPAGRLPPLPLLAAVGSLAATAFAARRAPATPPPPPPSSSPPPPPDGPAALLAPAAPLAPAAAAAPVVARASAARAAAVGCRRSRSGTAATTTSGSRCRAAAAAAGHRAIACRLATARRRCRCRRVSRWARPAGWRGHAPRVDGVSEPSVGGGLVVDALEQHVAA
eukprot:scaffold56461_cov60-Phaeocystis_antarctica.AAC.3